MVPENVTFDVEFILYLVMAVLVRTEKTFASKMSLKLNSSIFFSIKYVKPPSRKLDILNINTMLY